MGPTLTLIKSSGNKVFGGYTSQEWSKEAKAPVRDDRAFIFSISHELKFMPDFHSEKTIYPNKFCTFGEGHDIYISDNCH